MKKLGIITLHYIPNYGAVLQSYALKTILNRYCKAEIIDYRQYSREKNFSMKVYLNNALSNMDFRVLIKFPLHLIRNCYHLRFRKKLNKFYKQKLEIGEQVYKKNLNNLNKQYEGIVVGSDQVWNPKVLEGEYSLMLDFYHNKKYSYASSIGVESLPDKEIQNYRENLNKFKYVSCREKKGAEIINQLLLSDKCEDVLDPTLLLSKEEWNEKLGIRDCEKKYFLVYMVRYDRKLLSLAKELETKLKLEIIYIVSPAVRYKMGLRGIKCLYRIAPEKWIEYFNEAEMILTNSFHGIAFSINFNKQFYGCFDRTGDVNGTNSRMESILEMFNLKNRVISDIEQVSLNNVIDYDNVNEKLNDERIKSFHFIENIIDDFMEGA
jgi:hypothetical protein